MPEPVDPDDTLVDRIRTRGADTSKFATRPSAAQKVSAIFPRDNHEDSLRIIVQRPSSGE